ncbi:MAG: hypothetical protein WDO17_11230 [Alphaproteobacteria bacterium]
MTSVGAQFEIPDTEKLADLTAKLCDVTVVPRAPLTQLCATAIIRDEHIASLSLDLKEADRYALWRDALGTNDAETWIKRGSELVALAKRRFAVAEQDVSTANTEVAVAARRVDEVRSKLLSDSVVAEAIQRLRALVNSQAPIEQLAGPAREYIAGLGAEIEGLNVLADQWTSANAARSQVEILAAAVRGAAEERDRAEAALAALPAMPADSTAASELATQARDLVALVTLGRRLGLRDGGCPLCRQGQSHSEFEHGMAAAEIIARRINEQAAREAEREEARRSAGLKLRSADDAVQFAGSAHASAQSTVRAFDDKAKSLGFRRGVVTRDRIAERMRQRRRILEQAQNNLRIIETLRLSGELERTQRINSTSRSRVARAQDRFGRARKAEAFARALHDAARRAAGESVDQRLERVLPLMAELYGRLRPHPVWRDIEYAIRGDVRRFLKLQVGDQLNPQFVFSSGQRRATGLAFLLSANLSLTWSRWRSILLDDPVQHVDDFRAVHLAELAAQLVADGRQIICAVEDPALADLLCRRLPIEKLGEAKRITLGPDDEGAIAKLDDRSLPPLMRAGLFDDSEQSAAS